MNAVSVIDSRIPRESLVTQVIVDGPESVTFQTVIPPNPSSLSPIFNIQSPSPNSGMNRLVRLHAIGSITVNGSGIKENNIYFALRAYPLQSSMSNIQLQFGSNTASIGNMNQIVPFIATVANTSAAMEQAQSTAPVQPDQFCSYTTDCNLPTTTPTTGGLPGAIQIGSVGGVFSYLGQSNYGDAITSGRTNQITSVSYDVDGNFATINFELWEPLLISPLDYGNSTQKSIYGLGNLQVIVNYQNLARMLSWGVTGGQAVTVASSVGSFTTQDIQVSWVAPKANSLLMMPTNHTYAYSSITPSFTTAGGTFNPGTTIVVSSSTQEYPIIPSKFIIGLTYSVNDQQDPTQSLPDLFFPCVGSVSVYFGTKNGLLSSATPVNLWEIYRRNGGKQPYPVWNGQLVRPSSNLGLGAPAFVGGPLIIDSAFDLSLPEGLHPGMDQRISFQFTGSFYNQTAQGFNNVQLVILAITPGMLELYNGTSKQTLGGITPQEAFNAQPVGIEAAQLYEGDKEESGFGGGSIIGGSFLSKLWSGIKKVGSVAKNIGSVASPLLGQVARATNNPHLLAAHGVSSGIFGGRAMSRAQLDRF